MAATRRLEATHFTSALLGALLSGVLGACSVLPNEVISLPDGKLRAVTSQNAATYCQKRNARPVFLGRAPAEAGVDFRCE